MRIGIIDTNSPMEKPEYPARMLLKLKSIEPDDTGFFLFVPWGTGGTFEDKKAVNGDKPQKRQQDKA